MSIDLGEFRQKWLPPGPEPPRCALCDEPIASAEGRPITLHARRKGSDHVLVFHPGCFAQLEMRKHCILGEHVHLPDCKKRLAAFGPDHEPCAHGYHICPACHPCTCVCARCGCTASTACVTNGVPCHWTAPGLCSACAT